MDIGLTQQEVDQQYVTIANLRKQCRTDSTRANNYLTIFEAVRDQVSHAFPPAPSLTFASNAVTPFKGNSLMQPCSPRGLGAIGQTQSPALVRAKDDSEDGSLGLSAAGAVGDKVAELGSGEAGKPGHKRQSSYVSIGIPSPT